MLYYGADDGRVNGLEGEIPFEEIVKAQDIDDRSRQGKHDD